MSDYIVVYCGKCFTSASVAKDLLPFGTYEWEQLRPCRHSTKNFSYLWYSSPNKVGIVDLSDFEQRRIDRFEAILQ